MRRVWWLLAIAAVAALGWHVATSDQMYFIRHQRALEAFAADIFHDGSITELNRSQQGESRWLVNGTLVRRGPAEKGSRVRSWEEFLKTSNLDARVHDGFYERLGELGLDGFRADLDNHSIQFVRHHGERMIGYFYDERGETSTADLVSYEVITIDPHWELRRY